MRDRDFRGGDIALKAGKPRGLPFLEPLYGLPPYQYTDDVVLMIVYDAEEASIREVLPGELEPDDLYPETIGALK